MHTLAVTIVGVTKCGSQSRLLVSHDEEMRNQREGNAVPEKRPRSIEQRSAGQGEGRANVHRIADEFVRADDDQAAWWIEYGWGPSAYDDKGGDAPQRQSGATRSNDDAGDLRGANLDRSNDTGPRQYPCWHEHEEETDEESCVGERPNENEGDRPCTRSDSTLRR